MAWSWYSLFICLEGLRKTTKNSVRIASVLVEIQTKHLLNISLEYYYYAVLLSGWNNLIQACMNVDDESLSSRKCWKYFECPYFFVFNNNEFSDQWKRPGYRFMILPLLFGHTPKKQVLQLYFYIHLRISVLKSSRALVLWETTGEF